MERLLLSGPWSGDCRA